MSDAMYARKYGAFRAPIAIYTDAQGNAISWSSAGMMGFKGSRKSTAVCRPGRCRRCRQEGAEHGVRTLEVEVKARA
ncbi:MAG: 30S ribosomal protein S11, partial [Bacteroidia bacterium]|nr:30S ribosomal protein S11 [Bacteroidia bacterium]